MCRHRQPEGIACKSLPREYRVFSQDLVVILRDAAHLAVLRVVEETINRVIVVRR